MTFAAVLSGTVNDFSQESYKVRLAATLPGIAPTDITLTVAPASVRVTATITATSVTVANRTLTTLESFTPETLGAALGGLTVEAVTPPTLEVIDGGQDVLAKPDAPLTGTTSAVSAEPASGDAGMSTEVTVLVVLLSVGIVVVSFFLLVCCCSGCECFRPRRSQRAMRMGSMGDSVSSRTFDSIDIPDPKALPARISSTGGALERARSANAAARTAPTLTGKIDPNNPFFGADVIVEDDFEDPRLRL